MSESLFEEEAWEAEVAALLGDLPPVEPPPGFLVRAIEHRPLFAGRTVLGLAALASVAFVVTAGSGVFDPASVVPAVDSLAARHSDAAAGLSAGSNVVDTEYESVEDAAGPPVSLPDDFKPNGEFATDELRQSVFATGDDEAISVFSQRGRIDWSKLPAGEIETVEGTRAWTDPVGEVAVFEAEDSAVTIVGMSAPDLATVLDGVSGSSSGLVDKARNVAVSLSAELGFPDLG